MSRLTAAFLALILLLSLVRVSPVGAGEIRDLTVRLDEGRVLASFRLEGGFDERLIERAESGLPTTLVYEIELLRDRKRWFDRGLTSATLTVVGIYDALRREYLVNYKLDGRLLESRMVHDLDGLQKAMSEIVDLPAFTLDPELGGRRLLIRVQAELGYRHILGFIPSRITTDWLESKKFRPPTVVVP